MTLPAENCNFVWYDICMDHEYSLETIRHWLAILVLALIPIIFIPYTQDFYDTSKWMVVAIGAGLVLLLTGLGILIGRRHLHIRLTAGTIGLSCLAVSSVASFILASPNKIEALVSPLGPITLIALTILVAALSATQAKWKVALTWCLYTVTGMVNLIAIYQFLGMGKIMFPTLPFLQDPLWTPTGATVSALGVSVITLSVLIPDIIKSLHRTAEHAAVSLYILSLLVILAGTIVTLWQFIPKIPTSLMPLSAGWNVALEALKSGKAAVVGIGAENYVSAYTTGKPFSLLATPLWNVRFATGPDFFLHVITVYGILGLVSTFILAYLLLSTGNPSQKLSRIVVLLVLAFLPPTLTILALTAIVFVISDSEPSKSKTYASPLLRYAASTIIILSALVVFYGAGRYYGGEFIYFQAITAAGRNDGSGTYNLTIRAITTNTYMSRYHITLSQVSLALANGLAAKMLQDAATKKGPVNDADRKLTSELIQQAIAEAKIAITLSPRSITAWENFGNTYQAVMTIANGSDAWALAAYQKALSLDPTNPVLTVNLGGVLVHQKKYDDAVLAFQRAITLKPDYANAYYNLAYAYQQKGDIVNAKAALTKTLSLVPAGSSDYVTAQNGLTALENGGSAPVQSATGSSVLSLPK